MAAIQFPDLYVGDQLNESITISQAGKDFTGFSLDGLLEKDGRTLVSLDVSGTLANGDNSTLNARVVLDPGKTAKLAAGSYVGRVRITHPVYGGPKTIYVFSINLLA